MGLNFADGQNGVKLFEQLAAVLGIDNKRQRIRQIKAVNTEQRFRVDRIAAGNQIDLIRVSGQQIDKIALSAMDILNNQIEERHKRKPTLSVEPTHKIIPPILINRKTTLPVER